MPLFGHSFDHDYYFGAPGKTDEVK
jgi:hypothetical protein